MKKRLLILFTAFLAFFVCSSGAEGEITASAQLNLPGVIVGVSKGSEAEQRVKSEFPKAETAYYSDNDFGYFAVAQGKIDAFVYDYEQMRMAIENGMPGVRLLEETLGEPVRIAAGISPASRIPDLESRFNQFLGELRADGTLEDMYRRWVIDEDETMPEIALPQAPSLHLTVGTTGETPPYSYFSEGELSGYDVELARRFAAWLGADLEFKLYKYGDIVSAAFNGEADCILANLNITSERQKMLTFSDVILEEKLGVMVRSATKLNAGSELNGMNGKRIGVQAGTIYDEIVLDSLPDAVISYYSNYSDLAAALAANKIDGFPGDEPLLREMAAQDDRLTVLDGIMDWFMYGFVLPKTEDGQKLMAELDEWIESMERSGKLDRTIKRWTEGAGEDRTLPDYTAFPAPNGILTMATEGGNAPMNYIVGDAVTGMEIDLAAQFCEAYGYGLLVDTMRFDSILPAVQAGRVDFAAAGISMTEERQKDVLFSLPYYIGGAAMAVLKPSEADVSAALPKGVYTALDALDGKRIGVEEGAAFDKMIWERLPNATIVYYKSKPDMINALLADRIDACAIDEPVMRAEMRENDQLTYLPEYLGQYELGYVFPKNEKGQQLCEQFSGFLRELKDDGDLAELQKKWLGEDETQKIIPNYRSFSAENGVLRMATRAQYEPFAYFRQKEIAGYDIEIAVMFCEEYGYGLVIEEMNFGEILPAVEFGKCDFGGAGVAMTEERKESVLFSEPNFYGGTVLAVKKDADQ